MPTTSSNKWAAWGSNIMVKVKTSGSQIILANKQVEVAPEGEVVSTGKLVRNAEDLICQYVKFNSSMVLEEFGDSQKDEFIFVLLPEIAVQAILLPAQ